MRAPGRAWRRIVRTRGRSFAPLAVVLTIGLLASAAVPPPAAAAPAAKTAAKDGRRTENVILITIDGVRIQEIFGGMDDVIAKNPKKSGIYDLERSRERYWRETPRERREALMPYFWTTMAPRGMVLGNKEKGSRALVKNPLLFSAPGYAEILTGQPRADVTSNDLIRYPRRTVLEYAQRKLGLDRIKVAMVGSWEGFKLLASSEPDVFFTNGGYEDMPADIATPRMETLSRLQHQCLALWAEGRSDAITFGLGLEYIRTFRPRVFYLALGEPDDWSHARRYDRLLDYLNVADGYLRDLWEFLQSSDVYRGRTTVIITTDHGRGVRPSDWVEHGEGVRGAEDIWVAIIGPDTPDRGEVADHPTVYLADIAATMLQMLGLDPQDFDPGAGPPIPGVFVPAARRAAAGG